MKFTAIASPQQNITNLKKVFDLTKKDSYGYKNLVDKVNKSFDLLKLSVNLDDINYDELLKVFESKELFGKLSTASDALNIALQSDETGDINSALEQVYGSFPDWDIKIYPNLISISTYSTSNKSIMVYHDQPLENQIKTVIHETNHLIFHDRFEKKVILELGKQAFSDIKESFTILTNPEESGYPAHIKLRQYINDSYTKNKNINQIVDQLISGKYQELVDQVGN